MKSSLIIFCVVVASVVNDAQIISRRRGPPIDNIPSKKATKSPEWHTITQRLDHFNPTDLRTWSMRYLSNDQFFKNDGPIFIFLGGEWKIYNLTLMGGQIFAMAEHHKGYMFNTEHRYYGESYPTEDMSTENLKYLSADQAIADVAYFIKYIKENIKGLSNSKVVVIGASYSAMLATWIRLKYPHLVDAAYASSGPVRAVADFYEYFEVVAKDFATVDTECLKTISDGVSLLQGKLVTEEGTVEVSQALGTCNLIQNVEPYKSYLFNAVITGVFAANVQDRGLPEIERKCDKLRGYHGNSLNKLAAYIKEYYNGSCVEDYEEFIKKYVVVNNTGRAWWYQTCTEFGFYQTTTSNEQPFGNTGGLDYFLSICKDLFGENFGREVLLSGVHRTNLFYGSSTPEITKVVSVHGTVDPWHVLGILKDLNPLARAIVINGGAHCSDLGGPTREDSQEAFEAKIRAQMLIAKWIK